MGNNNTRTRRRVLQASGMTLGGGVLLSTSVSGLNSDDSSTFRGSLYDARTHHILGEGSAVLQKGDLIKGKLDLNEHHLDIKANPDEKLSEENKKATVEQINGPRKNIRKVDAVSSDWSNIDGESLRLSLHRMENQIAGYITYHKREFGKLAFTLTNEDSDRARSDQEIESVLKAKTDKKPSTELGIPIRDFGGEYNG